MLAKDTCLRHRSIRQRHRSWSCTLLIMDYNAVKARHSLHVRSILLTFLDSSSTSRPRRSRPTSPSPSCPTSPSSSSPPRSLSPSTSPRTPVLLILHKSVIYMLTVSTVFLRIPCLCASLPLLSRQAHSQASASSLSSAQSVYTCNIPRPPENSTSRRTRSWTCMLPATHDPLVIDTPAVLARNTLWTSHQLRNRNWYGVAQRHVLCTG